MATDAHSVVGTWSMDFRRRTAGELFAIAADIATYPRFVPWCIATRILEREADGWLVDNVFGFGPFRARFKTRAVIDAPWRIDIESREPPFVLFRLAWRFTPREPAGCGVAVALDMRFRSELYRVLARISLAEAERRILGAFRDRAERLYGPD